MALTKYRPVLLCVLDGFGYRADAPDNAVSVAAMPVWKKIWTTCPHTLLAASGEDVGLPKGQIGNSEVGHMNLGAGRVVYQDLPLIDHAIASGELAAKPELKTFTDKLKASGGTCHLMGLASPGGVHAHQDHILALAKDVAAAGVPVAIHAFLDGRDVPPQSADTQIGKLLDDIKGFANVRLATVCGRYYAMDRDKRWDRVEKAYDLLTGASGSCVPDAVEGIQASYVDGVYDEFVLPMSLKPCSGMKDGDGILFANFRADRAREILSALLDPEFCGFERKKIVQFAAALGMVEYSEKLNLFMDTLFPSKLIANGLGEIVAQAGLKQLRIAETEKYAHVTFFFNGGREDAFSGEERILIASPKVATYDLKPEMSAQEVTDKVIGQIETGSYDFIVLNYANPDMVGHTGRLTATVDALEFLDGCLGRLLGAIEKAGGAAFVTADHGNCEVMFDPATEGPQTAHTLSPVPAVLVGVGGVKALRGGGRLADVAPTLLALMGLAKPKEMSGESLIEQ